MTIIEDGLSTIASSSLNPKICAVRPWLSDWEAMQAKDLKAGVYCFRRLLNKTV